MASKSSTENPKGLLSNMNQRRFLQRATSIILFIGLGLAVLSIRLFADGKRHYEEAEQARSSGNSWRKTVMHYEDAARTYFPGNPYPHRAFWQLTIFAKSAQLRGESRRAAYIWEVIRRSAVSQRHVIHPFAEFERTARIHLNQIRNGKRNSVTGEEYWASPSAGWVVLLWIGLVAWIGGATSVIFLAKSRQRIYMGAISVSGAALWIVAAWLA